MTAFEITCTVIPEKQDDTRLERFVIIAPEDGMIWVAAWKSAGVSSPGSEKQKGAVARTAPGATDTDLEAEKPAGGDILELSDRQLDCRSRNLGRCAGYPISVAVTCDSPEGAVEVEDDCHFNVLECWMLEEAID